jgi:hypothetical protein
VRLSEILASYDEKKRQSEKFDLWLYHVGRRFSWPVAWAAINLGITATGVTFISALFVWTGALLIALGGPTIQLAGALCFQLWLVFDCADGTVARATKSGSVRGEYADAFGGYSVSMLLYSSMGVAAARAALGITRLQEIAGGEPVALTAVAGAGVLLLAGVGASLFSLYARLLYQKYLMLFSRDGQQTRTIKPRDDRQNPVMIVAQNVAANSGFALPLAVVALATGTAGWYVLFYCAVNAAMLALTLKRTFGRATPLPPRDDTESR